jgi:hypothetical protein
MQMLRKQMGSEEQIDTKITRATGAKKMLVTQDDFLFGTQSALQYEEFNVVKINRHKVKQKRVMVINNNQIYHEK